MNRSRSQFRDVQIVVSLSKLVASKQNPRRVKPQRDAHRRLVASIKAYGLLAPLVVRTHSQHRDQFTVIAGNRRFAALNEVYRDAVKTNRPPKIPCILRSVDDETAEALSLAENFVREAMHPLDEAEAFAELARDEAKEVEAIASDFGVGQAYVRQRMKLATLADPIKAAYRKSEIDTATAEAFAAVPPERQVEVWTELGGHPQHAQHVRNVINHAWIGSGTALFDITKLPDCVVSRDLFGDRTLIERKAFMEAQAEALLVEQKALTEDGWSNVVITPRGDVQDRLYAMSDAPVEYDRPTTSKLEKLAEKRNQLESELEELDETDETGFATIQAKLEALDEAEKTLIQDAPVHYAEVTKAVGTVFLLLDPDGRVRKEYRVPRQKYSASHHGQAGVGTAEVATPPTADDLKDSQLASTFIHQTLAVREALVGNDKLRKRILAMILHEKVRGEALAVRHDANAVTLGVDHTEGFTSQPLNALRHSRKKLDPFHDHHSVDDIVAFDALQVLSERKLDELIALLTVECLTAHMKRKTDLVWRLAKELGVNVRSYWRPDEQWLSAYQKIQLAGLIVELRGSVHTPAESKKKSELVAELAMLFADAAEGRLEDSKLSVKVNGWLPANVRAELDMGNAADAA